MSMLEPLATSEAPSRVDLSTALPPEEVTPPQEGIGGAATKTLATAIAWVTLLTMDLSLKLLGFFRFYRLVRWFPVVGDRPSNSRAVPTVVAAVDRASIYYFKRAWCFQRSATTVCLLRLCGLTSVMVIGISKMPFYAHAWVEVGGSVVNDAAFVQDRYAELERC